MRDLAGTDWELRWIDTDAPEHDDLVTAVGRVAMRSAQLESTLRTLFVDLMGCDEAFVIAEGESSDWLLKNCERVICEEHRFETTREGKLAHILPLISECRDAFRERGTVVHASWGIGPNSPYAYIAMCSKRFRGTRVYEYSIADMNHLADRFAELDHKVGSTPR